MVKLIFREGNRHVDPLRDLSPAQLEKIRDIVGGKVKKLVCAVHKSHSRATLLVDIAEGSSCWDIVDLCCEAFSHEISSGMPFPWDRPPGAKRLAA